MSYKYIPNNKHPHVPELKESTANKAIDLLPRLWQLLDEYGAEIPGDSEQEVSSIIIDDVFFNWLDNRNTIFVTIDGRCKGELINE